MVCPCVGSIGVDKFRRVDLYVEIVGDDLHGFVIVVGSVVTLDNATVPEARFVSSVFDVNVKVVVFGGTLIELVFKFVDVGFAQVAVFGAIPKDVFSGGSCVGASAAITGVGIEQTCCVLAVGATYASAYNALEDLVRTGGAVVVEGKVVFRVEAGAEVVKRRLEIDFVRNAAEVFAVVGLRLAAIGGSLL